MPATVSDRSIARFHRALGLVNLALALVCLATPAITSSVGNGMALLLAVCLLAGAALMFSLARCFDPRRRVGIASPSDAVAQLGARALAGA